MPTVSSSALTALVSLVLVCHVNAHQGHVRSPVKNQLEHLDPDVLHQMRFPAFSFASRHDHEGHHHHHGHAHEDHSHGEHRHLKENKFPAGAQPFQTGHYCGSVDPAFAMPPPGAPLPEEQPTPNDFWSTFVDLVIWGLELLADFLRFINSENDGGQSSVDPPPTGSPPTASPPTASPPTGSPPFGSKITIPVYYHVIMGSGSNSPSDSKVRADHNGLARAFRDTPFDFSIQDITRTYNNAWYGYEGFYTDDEEEMKSSLRRGGKGALNVWINKVNGLCGYTLYPEFVASFGVWDGIVLNENCMADAMGSTLTHEAGHWLGKLVFSFFLSWQYCCTTSF